MNATLLQEEYYKAQRTTAKQEPGIKLLRWINNFQCKKNLDIDTFL